MTSGESEPTAAEARRRRVHGLVALVIAQMGFGGFPVFVKLAVDAGAGFSPRALIAWRLFGGALVLVPLAALSHRRRFWPARSDWGRLFACSLLGIVVNQVLAVEGAARTHAIHAGVLFTTIPVFTYLVAVIARQERWAPRRGVGIGLALAGALVLLVGRFGGNEATAAAVAPVTGSVMIVANCLSYSIFLVIARPLLARLPMLVVMAWLFVLALWVTPFVTSGVDLWPETASAGAIQGLLGLVFVVTIFAYLANTFALARVSASTTAVFVYIQPVFAIAGASLVLGERIGLDAVVSIALLFAGIGLVIRRVDRTPG